MSQQSSFVDELRQAIAEGKELKAQATARRAQRTESERTERKQALRKEALEIFVPRLANFIREVVLSQAKLGHVSVTVRHILLQHRPQLSWDEWCRFNSVWAEAVRGAVELLGTIVLEGTGNLGNQERLARWLISWEDLSAQEDPASS